MMLPIHWSGYVSHFDSQTWIVKALRGRLPDDRAATLLPSVVSFRGSTLRTSLELDFAAVVITLWPSHSQIFSLQDC